MHKLNALEFTQKKIDTTMAENFINEYCGSDEWPETGHIFIEEQPNKITKFTFDKFNMTDFSFLNINLDSDKARLLTKKIEEGTEMFVQLEYLARGTDERDVRDGHVKLISQLLRCNDTLWNRLVASNITVTKDTPLYVLGAVAGCKNGQISLPLIVVTDKKMRYLCQYFVKICHEVGFNIALLYCDEDTEARLAENRGSPLLWRGTKCTGVISEESDLDSAIDAFIDSSITAPWRLQQIYVQENIFEDFKNALAVKTGLPAHIQQFALGNKIIQVEYLIPQFPASGRISIPVHAYRTTKELLSLLETQKSQYLSLWAANSALSNEIALRCSALTVWVNDFGSFDGPPRAALSVYNLYNNHLTSRDPIRAVEIMLQSWIKLRVDERLEKIAKVLNSQECLKELRDFALKWRSGDFVHVTDKTICFGVQCHIGVLIRDMVRNMNDVQQIIEVLLNGNGVIVKCTPQLEAAVDKLKEAGIPIYNNSVTNVLTYNQTVSVIMERMKVIRTNYGTIFAN